MSGDTKPAATWRETPEALAFHDVKNHLGVAIINATLLQRRLGEADPRALHHLELIQQSLEGISALTEHLRDFMRLAVTHEPVKRNVLSLEAVLEEALEGCRAARDGAAPRLEPAPPPGAQLWGERPTTPRMLTGLFAATLREAAQVPGVVLGITDVDGGLQFELAAPALRGDEPPAHRHGLMLALATAERLVAAHGGVWEPPALDAGPLRLGFVLPRAP